MLRPFMPGRHAFRLVSAHLLLLAGLAACGSTPVVPNDAALDSAILPMSRLLGACYADWQCPGPGAFCRAAESGYPGGICTLACTDRTDCDDGAVYNSCLTLTGETNASCQWFCRNGTDCSRPGYTCEVIQGSSPAAGFCIPVCATDAECGGTAQCDTYTGRCVAAGMVGTSGGLTGEACGSNAACRSGVCRQASEGTNFTGFVNGYCQSLCRIPTGYNTSDFFTGDTLPTGTCPGDAICIPAGNYGTGDLGVCLDACDGNADCRSGYECLKTFGTHTFNNGYCSPIDCNAGGATCPMGTCHLFQDSAGNVYGRCG